MKRRIFLLLMTGLLAIRVCAEPQQYSIQPNGGSRFELHVFKTGLYRGKVHTFLFPNYTGTFLYDAQTPEASRIELRLAANAMKCVDTWLNSKDLKSVQEYAINDMLVADQYPEIYFTSSEIRRLAASHFEVRGTLTIRGTGRPSTVDVTLQEDSVKSLVFRGAATIRLTDYGLKPPKALLGTIGTRNEMEFAFTLEAEIRP
jgi:polyisoprenoid-binding protein YceI